MTRVLVTYASRHGATAGIAERIAEVLTAAGLPAEARAVHSVADPSGYDAFVIGSAVYFGHWRKDALEFVRRHQALLATRPVWLFSSGPLGEALDDEGKDKRDSATPEEAAALAEAVQPRDHRVFFGVLDPATLGLRDRLIRALPAGGELLPEGDFRDWSEIESWGAEIARSLQPAGRPAAE